MFTREINHVRFWILLYCDGTSAVFFLDFKDCITVKSCHFLNIPDCSILAPVSLFPQSLLLIIIYQNSHVCSYLVKEPIVILTKCIQVDLIYVGNIINRHIA